MRYVNCNLCGQDSTELVNRGPDLLLGGWEHIYQLVRCRRCGLIYQNPQMTVEELLAYSYPENYICYPPDIESEKSFFTRLDRHFGMDERCRRIMRLCPAPGRLLDVGCATGIFMKAMQDRGWDVTGIEINPRVAEYARQTFGLAVITGTLEEAGLQEHAFDLVTLWGVLEHVTDPKATLVETARLLKPGGVVAIALPNPACLEARILGPSWVGWDRPRHLHIFTQAVLRRYLAEAGLALARVESFFGRLSITLLNIQFLCKTRHIPEHKWKPWLELLYNWPLRALSWPVYRLGEVFNQTTNIVFYARKDPGP